MRYDSIERILNSMSNKRIKREVTEILKNHTIKERRMCNEMFRCEACDMLYARLYFKINYDDDKVYESQYFCRKCNEHLTRIESVDEVISFDKESTFKCPHCHKKTLYQDLPGMWD